MILIKACLNGARRREEHSAVPISPDELARDAAAAVAAGAGALHFHPRDAAGVETLEAEPCAAALAAVRAACPGIPVGLSTGAWIASGAERERLVSSWQVLPDFVSVNLIEDGAVELCRLLQARGLGVEAGLTTLADVEVLRQSGLARAMCRLLIEVEPEDPEEAVALAAAIDDALEPFATDTNRRLHHGTGPATWPVLRAAAASRRDIRVGLEDTLWLPDATLAPDNASLVAAAVQLVSRPYPRPSTARPAPL
ncbi:MAG TPA: 3-keto-5-aminohexanoate cleavage protein [Kofleriaceae bacterium]|nr:3-keto-5-aminohexanoate cleavage protein [Kofleriaceae bacterium]